jgi:dolichol-phosphate mannosyltransferase
MPMNLSIVIPYYGCEGSLTELCKSIEKELAALRLESEVIFILDGPSGGSWEYLQKITEEFGFLCFQLTRNFGQHAATKAGLSLSTGSMVIVMDCDLQDPPSLIPILIESASESVDVVFAKREGKYDGIQRRVLRKTSRFFLSLIYPREFDLDTGSYMLLKRAVVDQIIMIRDNSHVGLLVNWLNYPSTSVHYVRDKRSWGKSNYNFQKLIGHGIEALSFNLIYFFRKLLTVSIIASIMFTFFGTVALVRALISQTSAGWASIFVLLAVGFSITLTMLSLIGFTLADKVSNRDLPQYLIRKDD